jgi:DNA-binding transcriptional LysR family regulator
MARFFDLDLLNALVVIAETGSLSAAAPQLCRSQSAVSEQVRKLEHACGTPLLLRGKTGASLTPAGERLVGHARQLLALSDAAYRDMQGALLAGDLRLAITDYFRPTAMPAILKRVRDQYPRLHLHVSIRKSASIEEDAASGDFDIGLSMTILDKEPAPAAACGQRIWLRREPLTWLAGKSFVLPPGSALPLVVLPDTCSLQRFVTRTLEKNHVPYVVAHSASGVGGLHLALSAGLGVTCLNASAMPEGAAPFAGAPRLPALPDVAFSLTPPRPGEPPVVSQVREMLAANLG